MMPNLGSRKKDNVTRMERHIEDLPQLSNEMQLSIMNKVKSGELSIEDALNEARKDGRQQHKNKIVSEEELKPSQYNFSVHKHSHHRWQKRVLQIDFKTKLLCSIEKGIIKRQLSFSIVKSCDDGEGSKFTISFKGHHDYELEATSLEDKHKMMQLVNQIIYGNIYSDDTETCQQSQASQSLQEGVLLLHRGGLASFKWVRYDAKLHPGQLTLVPFRRRDDVELPSTVPLSIVIHLSDGDTSVLKSHGSDTFTLITHKNEYQFRVPSSDQITSPGATQRQRDAWVQAIDKLCSDWKRKSMGEHTPVRNTGLQHLSIAEDAEDTHTDLQTTGGSGGENKTYPPVDYGNQDSTSGVGDYLSAGDMSQSDPSAIYAKPYPKPRSPKKAILPPVPLPTTPDVASSQPNSPQPSPSNPALRPTVPESPNHESGSAFVKVPAPPLPPPPLFNFTKNYRKPKTKAFHWDLVGPEKIATSFWTQESTRRIEIDTSRLYEQFAVKDLGTAGVIELSNRPAQNIMLNHKIAQNFNIFLKSFPVQPGELKDKLFIVNEEDGGLSDEHITSLRRYVPTVGDVEMYESYKGPVTELHIVDQYMMEMCNIPRLSTQLDLLLTLRELPISMEDLQPLINQKIKMCTQLNNCRSFVSVLEYLLAIGNYLNENARREKAKGFRLSSLTKLTQLRGKDRKFTLLHALVEQIMLHEPCLATFTQELAEFDTVPGASIKGLTAEVDVLKNELQKVIQYRKTYNKTNAGAHPNFSKDLKVVIEKYNTDLSALTKTCEEMKKLYSVILVKFGEPANQDSKELFGLICEFIHDFKEVHAEMI